MTSLTGHVLKNLSTFFTWTQHELTMITLKKRDNQSFLKHDKQEKVPSGHSEPICLYTTRLRFACSSSCFQAQRNFDVKILNCKFCVRQGRQICALEEISFNFAIISLRRHIMTTSALMKFLSVVRAGSVGPGVVGKPVILNNNEVPTLNCWSEVILCI